MLFNSFEFIFCFLPLTWLFFHALCARKLLRLGAALLVGASLVFYAYWNPPFVVLILFSVLFNYITGKIIRKLLNGGRRRILLFLGIGVNLSFILYFKYLNFFGETLFPLIGCSWKHRELFLPLGISFFTFQQIAYLVDCYRGKVQGHGFLYYALFVSFFPQLIAGPIVRYEDIIPQFQNVRTYILQRRNIALGLTLLSFGLFKKVVVADSFLLSVSAIFDDLQRVTFFDGWFGALAYTLQIYFDFSGYSDMAIGLGYLFNITLPSNFDSPYKSLSIIDFWRRWHISLSFFLRDYLYFPLGGSRKGELRRYLNLLVTMLLGGLWHGAAWMFVFWGGLHGVFLCINHLWRRLGFVLPRIIAWAMNISGVVVGWVFFRSPSMGRAWEILRGMFGMNGIVLSEHYIPTVALKNLCETMGVTIVPFGEMTLPGGKTEMLLVFAGLAMVIFLPNSLEWTKKNLQKPRMVTAFAVGVLFIVSLSYFHRISAFLYFQF